MNWEYYDIFGNKKEFGVQNTNGNTICTVRTDWFKSKNKAEEAAKLISAAPDLLEALTHLTANAAILKLVSESKPNSLLREWFDKSLIAIKKATL